MSELVTTEIKAKGAAGKSGPGLVPLAITVKAEGRRLS